MSETTQNNTSQMTQIITSSPTNTTATVSDFAPKGARKLIKNSDLEVEPVMFTVDTSLEFTRSLERTEKRYKRTKLMATGGFGRVFLAEDKVLGRKVVVKSLKDELLDKPEIVKKFITEAKLNAQLDHPSIVTVYSLDTDSSDGLHLAMQLINGITLKEYLSRTLKEHQKKHFIKRNAPKLLQERLEIFLHVCDAIDYCHSKGIVHNDLKPDNIMIGRYGEVYVMDWGIATPEGINRKNHLDGTPAYMPPETLRDGITNAQSDVFALGMMLNEIVTLRQPITADTPQEIIKRICHGDYEPSTSLIPWIKIPATLKAIIEKGRNADPGERYSNVKQMADDVRRFLFNEEVSALPDTILMKLSRFMYHHKLGTGLTILGLVICMAIMIVINLSIDINQKKERAREVNQRNSMRRLTEELNNIFLSTQLQGVTLSLALGMEYDEPYDFKQGADFYLNEDYAPNSTHIPAEMLKTSFYKNPISLLHGNYFVPEGFSENALQAWVGRISSLHGLHLADFLSNTDNTSAKINSKTESLRYFMQNGSILRRITYILNNDLVFRYPGTYEKNVKESSVFMDNWIKSAMLAPEKSRNFIWTLPHLDREEYPVISCWLPLLDTRGSKIGLLCIDLCYNNFVESLEEQAKDEAYQAKYYIITKEGQILYKSPDPHSSENEAAPPADSLLCAQDDFLYPGVVRHIMTSMQPQFKIKVQNKNMRVAWTKMNCTGWYLVRMTPENKFTWVDNLDNIEIKDTLMKVNDSYKKVTGR